MAALAISGSPMRGGHSSMALPTSSGRRSTSESRRPTWPHGSGRWARSRRCSCRCMSRTRPRPGVQHCPTRSGTRSQFPAKQGRGRHGPPPGRRWPRAYPHTGHEDDAHAPGLRTSAFRIYALYRSRRRRIGAPPNTLKRPDAARCAPAPRRAGACRARRDPSPRSRCLSARRSRSPTVRPQHARTTAVCRVILSA